MYILFYCDEWKSYQSRDIIGIYSSLDKLKERIKKEVKNGNGSIMNDADIDDLDHSELQTYLENLDFEYFDIDDME